MKHMHMPGLDRELKKGSAELLILSLVETRARHGYEISRLIDERSGGRIRFKVAKALGAIAEPECRRVLAAQRTTWQSFAAAMSRVTGVEHA